MASDQVIGPRGGTDAQDGAVQDPSFSDSDGACSMDLSAWAQKYVRISWAPASPALDGAKLFYLFVDSEAELSALDETSDSGITDNVFGPKEPDSPGWISGIGGNEHEVVPGARTKLIVKAEGAGRLRVGLAE